MEEVKFRPDDLDKEEIISYAMTVTGIMDHEIISDAFKRVFGDDLPNEKEIHKGAQKLLDAADKIEEENNLALVANYNEEIKDFSEENKNDHISSIDENAIIEEEKKSVAINLKEEKKFVETVKEEEKVVKGNGSSHIQYVMNSDGEKVIKPGPNKKCHCGSGMRYKKCCMYSDKERMDNLEQETEKKKKAEVTKSMSALYI